jgi:hypothetical protein
VPLPVELAGDICESCRHLIPDTPAGCCWWCTWDISPEEEEQYRHLIIAFETRVLADLAGVLADLAARR